MTCISDLLNHISVFNQKQVRIQKGTNWGKGNCAIFVHNNQILPEELIYSLSCCRK